MSALWKTYDILRDFLTERFVYTHLEAPRQDLSGQVILITGANTGLGLENARQLVVMKPSKLIITARNTEKGQAALKELQTLAPRGTIVQLEHLDLCSMDSVNKLSSKLLKEEKKLHVLVLNAGIGHCPAGKTEDGFDTMFQSNNLSHFLLVENLLPLLDKASSAASPARIVGLSSLASKFTYSFSAAEDYKNMKNMQGYEFYSTSKLMVVVTMRGLARRFAKEGRNITTYAVHPGTVNTDFKAKYDNAIGRIFPIVYALVGRPLPDGAATQTYVASAPEVQNITGKYWSNMRVTQMNIIAESDELCDEFVGICEALVKKYQIKQ
ncbi:hypothetical protein BCR37DRAFT_390891 [Protomyces lactucae-debilis]|uniref:Uncharacterized protein n=1 Tax=Protomyces lactucae-debilis TaxID=2754530 RepID=A0A1Y2FTS6_PROLT|nr:uncharacterized protein BCR37DRAFT_390891 [Protomyces lactucae-debilis]ORY86095.1 hypothetical protein BCR37DRAFT_390891 [Protomyces lactucae-debilis]